MTEALTSRPATADDLAAVLGLLQLSGLPLAGVSEHIEHFLLVFEGSRLVGCAGLEVYGDTGLLRSVAVDSGYRGRGLGRELTQAILESARQKQLSSLSLLTTTAEHYFPRFGFKPVQRSELPIELQDSEELRGACPDTAIAMTLKL